ncbi:MAG: MATE family efflux transporter [Candidatus Kapaibacteriales bacterium]
MAVTKIQIKELTLLSIPLILGQLSHMLASFADRVMLGQYSTLSLASFGLVNNIHAPLLLIFIGVAMGITPIVGKMNGAGDNQDMPEVFKSGLKVSIITSVCCIAFLLGLYFYLNEIASYLDYDMTVIRESENYFLYIIASFIPYTLFLAVKQFQEGLEVVRPMMIGAVIGNAVNIILNYLLIYGNFGFPEMGTDGAGLGTFLGRMVMMLTAIAAIVMSTEGRGGLKGKLKLKGLFKTTRYGKKIISIGGPIGFQFAMEGGAFAAGAFIIFNLGAIPLAAHEIAIGLAAFTFMTASGVGQGATIQVSNLIGAGNFKKMKNAADSSYVIVAAFMFLTALIFVIFRNQLPYIFVDDANVAEIASTLLLIAGLFQLVDGIQINGMGVLRGMEDVKVPTYTTIFGYWVLAIPLGYLMAMEWGFGATGPWYGYLIGLTVVGGILYFRYRRKAQFYLDQLSSQA